MFKHLLVPTDGSSLSKATIERAVSFAKEACARITFFYAKPEAPAAYAGIGAISSPHLTQDVRERLDSAARDILNTAQQMAQAADVVSNQVMLVGNHPAELIIQAAKSNDCDLIFMTSHGRSGVTALLLGSETHKVLTHSKIPVLAYQ